MVKGYTRKNKTYKKPKLNKPEEKALEDIKKNYGVTVVKDDEEIDLSNPIKGPGRYIAVDISRPVFPNCRKLSLCLPGWQQKQLLPQMPKLRILELVQSTIKKLYLHKGCYPNLSILNLWGNQIYNAECLSILKDFNGIVKVGLADNPIADNMSERAKLEAMFPSIHFIY